MFPSFNYLYFASDLFLHTSFCNNHFVFQKQVPAAEIKSPEFIHTLTYVVCKASIKEEGILYFFICFEFDFVIPLLLVVLNILLSF